MLHLEEVYFEIEDANATADDIAALLNELPGVVG